LQQRLVINETFWKYNDNKRFFLLDIERDKIQGSEAASAEIVRKAH
jgi:hypothetical protein